MIKKILASIIIYEPESSLEKLVDKLIEQNAYVFLFINKGNFISDKIISSRILDYYVSPENIGISSAFNKIIKKFKKEKYNYLFTFDQDSLIEKNFIKLMIENFENAYIENKNTVCCSPTIIDRKFSNTKSYNYKLNFKEKKYKKVTFAITSGCLFTKKSFTKVGIMNELLFIDGVDMDWCERANFNNYILVRSRNVFLKHKIGQKYFSIFGIKKSFHDNNLRVYYIIRNSIYLIFNGTNSIRWKLREFAKTFLRLIAYPLLSTSKIKTIKFEYLAIKDACVCNMKKMKYIKH